MNGSPLALTARIITLGCCLSHFVDMWAQKQLVRAYLCSFELFLSKTGHLVEHIVLLIYFSFLWAIFRTFVKLLRGSCEDQFDRRFELAKLFFECFLFFVVIIVKKAFYRCCNHFLFFILKLQGVCYLLKVLDFRLVLRQKFGNKLKAKLVGTHLMKLLISIFLWVFKSVMRSLFDGVTSFCWCYCARAKRGFPEEILRVLNSFQSFCAICNKRRLPNTILTSQMLKLWGRFILLHITSLQ